MNSVARGTKAAGGGQGQGLHARLLGAGARAWLGLRGEWARLGALEAWEELGAEEGEARTAERLRGLLRHAREGSEWWARRMADAGCNAEGREPRVELGKLPPLTRAEIQEHGEELRTASPGGRELRWNRTSGSTGQVTYFYTDAAYRAWNEADKLRCYREAGYALGGPVVFLWAARRDDPAGETWRERAANRWLRNLVWLDTMQLTESRIAAAIGVLRGFRPRLVVAYASSARVIAERLRAEGGGVPGLMGVQTSAELLPLEARAEVEAGFGAPVFDRYGCREVGIIAHDCAAAHGQHVSTHNNLVEILRPDGTPAAAGEMGRIVVTNLHNRAHPFLRYEVGDLGAWSAAPCACGRTTAVLAQVLGRSVGQIVLPDGRLIHGQALVRLIWKVPGVQQFQVVQEAPELLRVRFVLAPGADPSAAEAEYERRLRAHVSPTLRIEFERCRELPPHPSGKIEYVISRVPNPYLPSAGKTSSDTSDSIT